MSDLSDVIEQVRELGDMMDADGISASQSYLRRLDSILEDLEALRDWPEDHGHYIGVPVADDPDRQEGGGYEADQRRRVSRALLH